MRSYLNESERNIRRKGIYMYFMSMMLSLSIQ
jgi:hypothetical protein